MNFIRLSTWIKEEGFDPVFIGIGDSKTFKEADKAGLLTRPISPAKKYFSWKAGRKLAMALKKEGIKILVFSHGFDMDLVAWTKKELGRAISTVYVQQMQLGLKKRNPYQNWRHSKVDKWVVPLKWLEDELRLNTNVKSKQIVRIPLGQDLESFSEFELSRVKARKEMGIDHQEFLCGMLGRLDPAKGMDKVIEEFALALEGNPSMNLVIMGENTRGVDGDYQADLVALGDKLGISNRIKFLPFREDPKVFYRAIDAFVMGSEKETFGMVTVEAMASSQLVLASNSGGSPELLNGGDAGILFDRNKKGDLARKLEGVASNPDLKKEMGAKAREFALGNYSKKIVLDSYLKLIQALF